MAITGKKPSEWSAATVEAVVEKIGEAANNVQASKASVISTNKVVTYEITPESFLALAIRESAEVSVTPDVILEIKVGSKTYIFNAQDITA